MNWREYVAKCAFEKIFCGLQSAEYYGVPDYWCLYNKVQNQEMERLEDVHGELTLFADEYEGGYLPDMLEEEFYHIKGVVRGVKAYDVDLTDCGE